MLDSWNLTQGALKKTLYLALRMRGHLNRAAAIHCATEIERDHVMRLKLRPPIIVEPHGLNLHEFRAVAAQGQLSSQISVTGRSSVRPIPGKDRPRQGS
jgi:hypothetical protein